MLGFTLVVLLVAPMGDAEGVFLLELLRRELVGGVFVSSDWEGGGGGGIGFPSWVAESSVGSVTK